MLAMAPEEVADEHGADGDQDRSEEGGRQCNADGEPTHDDLGVPWLRSAGACAGGGDPVESLWVASR